MIFSNFRRNKVHQRDEIFFSFLATIQQQYILSLRNLSIRHLRHPTLERLCFRRWNRLDDTEKLLCIRNISKIMLSICRLHFQLVTNLLPTQILPLSVYLSILSSIFERFGNRCRSKPKPHQRWKTTIFPCRCPKRYEPAFPQTVEWLAFASWHYELFNIHNYKLTRQNYTFFSFFATIETPFLTMLCYSKV